jgi:hypothetical protein
MSPKAKTFLGVPTPFRQMQDAVNMSFQACEETHTFGGRFEVTEESLNPAWISPVKAAPALSPQLQPGQVRVEIIPKKIARVVPDENMSPLSTLKVARANLKRVSRTNVHPRRRSRMVW